MPDNDRRFPILSGRGRTIPWAVAERAYEWYAKRYGTDQSLERIAQRGGFSEDELDEQYPAWRVDSAKIDRAPDNDRAPATEDVEALKGWLSACSASSWDRYDIRLLKEAGDRLAAALRAEYERARKAEEALAAWRGRAEQAEYDANRMRIRAARARESGGGA